MIYHIHWEMISAKSKLEVYPAYISAIARSGLDYIQFYPYKLMVESGLTWTSLPTGSPLTLLAEAIKESKEDSFLFVLVNTQLNSFDSWIAQHKLEDQLMFRMHRPITNNPYPGNGRNLTLVVMMSKDHPYTDMFNTTEEINHEN